MTENRLAENLHRVRDQMEAAARRAGREPAEVRLVAVTKYVDRLMAQQLAAAGCVDLAESRPQRLWSMAESWTGPPVQWHLVGGLQRNKIARTLPIVSLIHSVDSERLLTAINEAANKLGRAAHVLLEIHLSGEVSKQGLSPSESETIVRRAMNWPHVRLNGLMTMAPLEGGSDAARAVFRSLHELRDSLRAVNPALALTELSMGMSGDFEVAIEEGATMVRIGSALFEGLLPDP